MAVVWTVKQYGTVVDDFRRDCDEGTWNAVLLAFSVLREKGTLCGPSVAKKLRGGDGIWELLAGYKNSEPRLLFYFSKNVRGLMIFVCAFIKKSSSDYKPAIRLARQRRALIEQERAVPHDLKFSRVN